MSYKCQVVDDLEALFKKQMFTDVMFCVDGKEFGAHKAVLAGMRILVGVEIKRPTLFDACSSLVARSPVFVAMFKHEMLEQKCSVVNITDLSSEELEEMLRYIYTGKVLNLKRMGVALLAVADKVFPSIYLDYRNVHFFAVRFKRSERNLREILRLWTVS